MPTAACCGPRATRRCRSTTPRPGTTPARSRPRTTPSRLELLGKDRATLTTPTATHRLTARHSEIVALLSLNPDGLDARTLSRLLYGETGHEVAVRAELHRLRDILGPGLATRPYRLVDIDAYVEALQRRLRHQSSSAVLDDDPGPLLPGSTVPAIVVARERLAAGMPERAAFMG